MVDHVNDDKPRGTSPRSIAVGVWAAVAFVWFILQAGPVFFDPGWLGDIPSRLGQLRNWAQWDQLSYLAISSNVQQGLPALTEPFTATGYLSYSSGYYLTLGGIARATGVGVVTVWNVIGLTMSLGLVTGAGWFAHRQIKRPWAPLLGLAPLLIGSLSAARYGNWFVRFEAHSFVWPPYATFYLINAELVALLVGGAGLVLVLSEMLRQPDDYLEARRVLIGFLLVGLTASLHLYVFIGLTLCVSLLVAFDHQLASRNRVHWYAAAGGLLLLYPAGHLLATVAGPAVAAAALVIPVTAGLLPALRTQTWRVSAPWLALLAGASPHLLRLGYALASGDPFIEFRRNLEISQLLDVPIHLGVFLHLPILLLLGWMWTLMSDDGDPSRTRVERALISSLATSWFVLSFNNYWGFTQEPYRFMMIVNILIVAIVPTLIVRRLLMRRTLGPNPIQRRLAIVALGALVVSLADLPLWWSQMREFGTVERPDAALVDDINDQLDERLVLLDPCLNPYVFKVETGSRVAWFNDGIALPAADTGVERLFALRRDGTLDLNAAAESGVGTVISHTGCEWNEQLSAETHLVASFPSDGLLGDLIYPGTSTHDAPGSITLWSLD